MEMMKKEYVKPEIAVLSTATGTMEKGGGANEGVPGAMAMGAGSPS